MKKVSVVIPNYKKQPLIKYLPAVIKACPQAEIIVADDASPDDTVSYLKTHFPKVKVVSNQTNQRFAITFDNSGTLVGSYGLRGNILDQVSLDQYVHAFFELITFPVKDIDVGKQYLWLDLFFLCYSVSTNKHY